MTEYTKGLCDFITKLKFEDLAPDLTDKAKKLTLHVAGVALAGRTLPTAVSARSAARATVGTQADLMSTMWGEPGKLPMHGAIMANATAADTLDWEDCSYTGHPSAHLVSVSMAMTEAMHRSGKDYLTAVIGGLRCTSGSPATSSQRRNLIPENMVGDLGPGRYSPARLRPESFTAVMRISITCCWAQRAAPLRW